MEKMSKYTSAFIKVPDIKDKVYKIRGLLVMLDFDLATIYGYEVKNLNQ